MSDTARVAFWLLWASLAAVFLLRRRPEQKTRRHEPAAWLGMALQAAGVAVVFVLRRSAPASAGPLAALPGWAGVSLAAGSVWLAFASVRALGKQWALRAQVVEGHELVSRGPYAYVRHPIYTSMLGMLVASGVVLGTWTGVAAGLLLYLAGTGVRTHCEEQLLRAEFGHAFEEYRRRVGWLVPLPIRPKNELGRGPGPARR